MHSIIMQNKETLWHYGFYLYSLWYCACWLAQVKIAFPSCGSFSFGTMQYDKQRVFLALFFFILGKGLPWTRGGWPF